MKVKKKKDEMTKMTERTRNKNEKRKLKFMRKKKN